MILYSILHMHKHNCYRKHVYLFSLVTDEIMEIREQKQMSTGNSSDHSSANNRVQCTRVTGVANSFT